MEAMDKTIGPLAAQCRAYIYTHSQLGLTAQKEQGEMNKFVVFFHAGQSLHVNAYGGQEGKTGPR